MNKAKFLLAFALAAATSVAHALELPNIFGDNMMLQQNTKAKVWGWAKPDSKVTVEVSWTKERFTATADADGKWLTEVSTPVASYDTHTMTVRGDGTSLQYKNVLIGEVWFCSGQSNMEMPLRGFWNCPVEGANEEIALSGRYRKAIRVATFPKTLADTPQRNARGGWDVCDPAHAPEFSALGYFFAKTLTDILDVPVGIIHSSYGGSSIDGWLPKEVLLTYPDGMKPMDNTDYHRKAAMYNAMLYPLAGYTVKGFLWNQGESDIGRERDYHERFITMTRLWRKMWNQPQDKLPMYTVELPPHAYGNANGENAARFREMQHSIDNDLENSVCICTNDLARDYEANQIHGSMKREIGQRMAYMAAVRDYDIQGIKCYAPQFHHMDIREASPWERRIVAGSAVSENAAAKGKVAYLYFTNARDGFDRMENIEGFEAAGADGVWHPARVWASSPQQGSPDCFLKLVCPEVPEIVDIRYNFKNFAPGHLHNVHGLPLVPFTTKQGR